MNMMRLISIHLSRPYLVLGLICLTGCHLAPVDELGYIGKLPPNVIADYPTAKEFADELAAQADLQIVNEYTNRWFDVGNITLLPKAPLTRNEGPIPVFIYPEFSSKHVLFVLVNGDIHDLHAQEIATKAEEIFEKKYPGCKLVRQIRYQGLAP